MRWGVRIDPGRVSALYHRISPYGYYYLVHFTRSTRINPYGDRSIASYSPVDLAAADTALGG